MVNERYNTNDYDPEDTTVCGIKGCHDTPEVWIWITIGGREVNKRFCKLHSWEESDAEKEYKLGL